jgi:hypothetical protein
MPEEEEDDDEEEEAEEEEEEEEEEGGGGGGRRTVSVRTFVIQFYKEPKIVWIKRSAGKDKWRNVDHRGDGDQTCVVRRRPPPDGTGKILTNFAFDVTDTPILTSWRGPCVLTAQCIDLLRYVSGCAFLLNSG